MKKITGFCSALAVLAGIAYGGSLTFQNYFDYVYTMDANRVDNDANWVYALYWDSAGDGAGGWNAADDVFIYSNNEWNDYATYDGVMDFNVVEHDDLSDGRDYFVRVYNSSDWTTSDVGNATHFVNLDMIQDKDAAGDTQYTVYTDTRTYESGGAGVEEWDAGQEPIGGSNPDGSDWQAIPEPSTFMLLGLGLATILARRKLRK